MSGKYGEELNKKYEVLLAQNIAKEAGKSLKPDTTQFQTNSNQYQGFDFSTGSPNRGSRIYFNQNYSRGGLHLTNETSETLNEPNSTSNMHVTRLNKKFNTLDKLEFFETENIKCNPPAADKIPKGLYKNLRRLTSLNSSLA
jgi:hypothetical protein